MEVVAEFRGLEVTLILMSTILLIVLIKKFTYASYLEYMEKRMKFVNESIDEARLNKEETEKKLSEVSAQESEIRSKKSEIYAETSKSAAAEKNEIINSSKEQARQIIEKANQEVELEKANVEKELSQDLVELVSMVSAKFLEENMTQEEESKLINAAIGKIENENK